MPISGTMHIIERIRHMLQALNGITAMTLVDLLGDGAAVAYDVEKRFEPSLTKKTYLEYTRKITHEQYYEGLSLES